MGVSCSIGAAKTIQFMKQSEIIKSKSNDSVDGTSNIADRNRFTNFAYENWLSSSTLKSHSKKFASLAMPAALDVLFDDVLLKTPQERPYVEPETEAEIRKRLKKKLLDEEKGTVPKAIRETLSEKEASGGRYLRIFVWSNVEANLAHQALHQIVIPRVTEMCKRAGVCIVWVDFRWASSSSLSADASPTYLSRNNFSDMQEMVEAEMERCFCMSPLLNFFSMTADDRDEHAVLGLPLRAPKFIISQWIKASRTMAAAAIEKAYPGHKTASDPMDMIRLDTKHEAGDTASLQEIINSLEGICGGGSSIAGEETVVAITNEMIASLISDPTEIILRRRMKLELGSDSALFPLTKCRSMISYCYYGCFDKVFSARSAIIQKKPDALRSLGLVSEKNEIPGQELEPMSRLPRLHELLFDMRNNIHFLHLRNNFEQRNGLEEHISHFCSSATEHIVERLKLAIVEREKYLPGALEGHIHFRLMRDAVLNRCWDTATVGILQLCWLPDTARCWRHASPTLTDCLLSEKKLLETSEEFCEADFFKKASQGFLEDSHNSAYNKAAISALSDNYEETNFWRLLEERKKLHGALTSKQKREKAKAMTIAAKNLFQQQESHIEVNAKMTDLKHKMAESLATFAEDFGLLADLMSIKRHGCVLLYDSGESSAVSSIMNALGVLKTKLMDLPNRKDTKKFNIVTRSAMMEDAVCNFSDLVTSICEELAAQSISNCDKVETFIMNDFTNHSEALKLSAFLQAIPEEQPTVIFIYGIQKLFQTDKISSDICPEKIPPWVLLILHTVCAPSSTAETLIRSSFRGKCEIFGGITQSSKNSYVAMVEQLFISGCKQLDTQASNLCKTVYCGKRGVLTTRCHILMYGKCMEWNVFADDPGLLNFSAEMRQNPNQVITKHYILGVIQTCRFSKMSTFAALSFMAASRSEVAFNMLNAFVNFVKKQPSDVVIKGYCVQASSSSKDVLKLLSEIQREMKIEENNVRTTEWNLFFLHFKSIMSPTIYLRGLNECYSLMDGILRLDVRVSTEKIVSQAFSKMVLLALRYHEPWKYTQAFAEKQAINTAKIIDVLPLVIDLGLQTFALDLLLDFDFVSHYFEAGFTTKLEMLYTQVTEFSGNSDVLRKSTILRDIQRFIQHNKVLFLSGQRYDLLSLLFNFNGGSMYFEAITTFREKMRKRGEVVNSVWLKNKSEYGKRDTLRWMSDARGTVTAWCVMNELNYRYCVVSISMPESRLLIFNTDTGKTEWKSPDNLITECHISIKSSNSNEFLVSCSKSRVFVWKKIGTYADSGYIAIHSFQLLKNHISGLDLSPNDLNFCTFSDLEGLTVTSWSIVTNLSTIDKLDHMNMATTSVYHVGLLSTLRFARFLTWDNVLLTSESNGEMSLNQIHKSTFGLSTNPGSSLTELIRWSIPQHSTERKATSMQWLQQRNILVLSDVNFVIFYEIILTFENDSCPTASVSPLQKLQEGFAPASWYSSPIVSVVVLDPRLPELKMNFVHGNQDLESTLIAIITTETSLTVWSTEPYNNLPEQILIEFIGSDSPVARVLVKNGASSIILNTIDQCIMQRDLEISRYGMIDNTPANGCIDDIHFTSNNSMIVCSCKSGEVSLYSGTSGFLKFCRMMNQASISTCSSFCNLTSNLYSGDSSGHVICFNMKSGNQLPSLKNHQSMVTAMAMSLCDLMLVSGDSDGNLTTWSTRSGQMLLSIPKAHSDSITFVKFSQDSSTVWSSSLDGRVTSWLCKDGKALHASRVSDVSAQSFDITSNMQLIATCGNDSKAKVWNIPVDPIRINAKGGVSKTSFKLRVECVNFERSLLQSVIFAKQDASIVAACCANGTMRLFNTTTGLVMLTLNCPGVTRLAISSNYEYLALATKKGLCSVFSLHSDDDTATSIQTPGA